jgi:hypothetical protein
MCVLLQKEMRAPHFIYLSAPRCPLIEVFDRRALSFSYIPRPIMEAKWPVLEAEGKPKVVD